ncbi:MAG: amidophosphoribosyltransferase [Deltaproteobacteria bacterium]|nr:amidophosphoribosyltransferase [Deltaproteobacteria bacterium]MBI3076834.1 amidophosphoribosyltransferase [Deltaproteobacteria bacterium]
MFDKFRDECGIFGIYGHPEAANVAYLGLYALQHRGQESAGIATSDGSTVHVHREMGLVADVFDRTALKKLTGTNAIGHVRYSTAGSSQLKNAQPLSASFAGGSLAVAHNGNLTNAQVLRDDLEARGSIFHSTSDTEVILHLLALSKQPTLLDRVVEALSVVKGAYSLLMLTRDTLIAARDSYGFRPLALGTLGDAPVLSSESCAFDLIEAKFVREVEPGEIVVVDDRGVRAFKPFPQTPRAFCVFELIYFARPDSSIFGRNVYAVRKELGRELAREHPAQADVVIPIPDSGVSAAIGYAQESGLPFETGLIRNHYVGRTFIEPRQSIRHFGVKVKLNAVEEVIHGRRVVVVDDSIVRGTTIRKLVKMIRHAGAREVHVRISSPPTTGPCFYGIDTPTRAELIASSHNVAEIRKYILADSLGYLSVEGLRRAVRAARGEFCDACFTGNYPVKFPGPSSQLPLFREG